MSTTSATKKSSFKPPVAKATLDGSASKLTNLVGNLGRYEVEESDHRHYCDGANPTWRVTQPDEGVQEEDVRWFTLSKKQQDILEFIEVYIDGNNWPPTVREIQEALKISSTSVVDYNLDALENKGKIIRKSGKSRAIELVDRPRRNQSEFIPYARSDRRRCANSRSQRCRP